MEFRTVWTILILCLSISACDTIVLKRINISNLEQKRILDLKNTLINWADKRDLECDSSPNCLDCSNNKKRIVFIEDREKAFLAYGLAAPIWIGDEVEQDLKELKVIVSTELGAEVVFNDKLLPRLGICE